MASHLFRLLSILLSWRELENRSRSTFWNTSLLLTKGTTDAKDVAFPFFLIESNMVLIIAHSTETHLSARINAFAIEYEQRSLFTVTLTTA